MVEKVKSIPENCCNIIFLRMRLNYNFIKKLDLFVAKSIWTVTSFHHSGVYGLKFVDKLKFFFQFEEMNFFRLKKRGAFCVLCG